MVFGCYLGVKLIVMLFRVLFGCYFLHVQVFRNPVKGNKIEAHFTYMIFRIPYIISKFSFMTYGTVQHFTIPVPHTLCRTSAVHQYGTYSLYGLCMVLVQWCIVPLRNGTVRYRYHTLPYCTVWYMYRMVLYCTVPAPYDNVQYGTVPVLYIK